MLTINMLTRADSVKGQGVLSATEEQINLVTEGLKDYQVVVNQLKTYDITHIHTINPDFLIKSVITRQNRPMIASVHFLPETLEKSISLPRPLKELFYKYVLQFYKQADYLVTVNPRFIEDLEHYGISKEKITYIPNFVSRDTFYKITDRSKAALRESFGLDPNKFTVVSAGQLQMRKGVLEFIDLAKKMPDIQFVWAGDFAFKGISEGRKEIMEHMDELPGNVHFLGLVERERMNEFFNMGDVMLQLSFEELFPMTILESMNANIPLLLRDLREYRPILFDYYLKGNSQVQFQEILRQLQQDEAFYQEACEKSRKGEQFYSKENVLQQWQAFYDKVAVENHLK
ncbi:glycosyltransferase family 4 protein [Granulicatella elegans]|uniref:glycosyltransferase family 4 protein n=1 Tax=Granulicatella elegans TaxID=137732 RepID=UPI000A8FF21A|nr:glycosyltransferase family 4 protein [Granulicatella elegans]UEA31185.1 glycosyltransferase family 4 protein [Granulicatella elegans]